MSSIKETEKMLLFSSVIYNPSVSFNKIRKEIIRVFGEIIYETEELKFEHTSYYAEEMGHNLVRRFVFFNSAVDPDNVFEYKIKSNKIEELFVVNKQRRVNVDPGYATLSKVCLLTTKNFSHRIYLRGGIYAEVTLSYQKKKYRTFEWTYPDYASDDIKNIFYFVRNKFNEQLR